MKKAFLKKLVYELLGVSVWFAAVYFMLEYL